MYPKLADMGIILIELNLLKYSMCAECLNYVSSGLIFGFNKVELNWLNS
jgi:hypothetical protein